MRIRNGDDIVLVELGEVATADIAADTHPNDGSYVKITDTFEVGLKPRWSSVESVSKPS